jgi:hypothetical protein
MREAKTKAWLYIPYCGYAALQSPAQFFRHQVNYLYESAADIRGCRRILGVPWLNLLTQVSEVMPAYPAMNGGPDAQIGRPESDKKMLRTVQ